MVRVPIKNGTTVNGSLEIAERLQGLEARRELLRVILISSTIIAAFFILAWRTMVSQYDYASDL